MHVSSCWWLVVGGCVNLEFHATILSLKQKKLNTYKRC